MKYFLVILLSFLNYKIIQAQAEIIFDRTVINFDSISYNEDGTFVFKFTNTGNEPLIISNAQTSCGCFAVRFYPNEPILPGKSSAIVAKYDTKRVGRTHKTLTVTSNAANNPCYVLSIKGKVIKAPILKDLGFIKRKTTRIWNYNEYSLDSVYKIIGGDSEITIKRSYSTTYSYRERAITHSLTPIRDTGFYQKQITLITTKYDKIDTINYTLGYRIFDSSIDVKFIEDKYKS